MRADATAPSAASTSDIGRSRALAAATFLSLLLALILGVSLAQAAVPPTVDGTFAINVKDTSANLGALIDTGNAKTSYRFEYIDDAAYQKNLEESLDGFTEASRAPAEADATLTAATTPKAVSQHLTGLGAATTYHYRVFAGNSKGEATSPVRTITTQETSPDLALPDQRGYEMVSPVDKNGGGIAGIGGISAGGVVQVAPDGNSITYASLISFADPQSAPLASQYLSTRGSTGWATQSVSAPTFAQTYPAVGAGAPYKAFSTDLQSGLLLNGNAGAASGVNHPVESPPLPGTDAPEGYQNYYVRNNGSGDFQALLTNTNSEPLVESNSQFNMEFLGATPDLSHVVVSSQAALTPGAVDRSTGPGHGYPNLYEWSAANGGHFESINVLPGVTDGTTAPESLGLGSGSGLSDHAISDDGSSVIWNAVPNTGLSHLYVRKNVGQPQSPLDVEGNCTVAADACTLRVDASQGPDSGVNTGEFMMGTADGSRVLFAKGQNLTNDANTGACSLYPECRPGRDLYSFDVNSGVLTDLTVSHNPANTCPTGPPANETFPDCGAQVVGVLGASEDGSYVYYVANGVVATNEGVRGSHALQGNCHLGTNPPGASCNLYLYHEGATTFISKLSAGDNQTLDPHLGVADDWDRRLNLRTTRVSPDGRRLVFMSLESLTGYDNTVASGDSCGFGGAAGKTPLPAQCEEVFTYDATAHSGEGALTCVSCNPSGTRPVGESGISAGTPFENNFAIYQSRLLSSDGRRVFFESADALVPQDTNGAPDVYQWEAQGTGTCTQSNTAFSAQNEGCVSLISTGTSAADSEFVDASEDGSDVFFITDTSLVPQDPGLRDLYDARIGGGYPPPPPPPAPCEGDACQSPAFAPNDATPGTATLKGPGNKSEAFKHHHKKRQHKKSKKRAANRNHGGAK